MTQIRRALKQASFKTFVLFDRVGIHILPKHYYTAIPDYAWLVRNQELWTRRTDLTGVDWNLDKQVAWLELTCGPYMHEVQGLARFEEAMSAGFGLGYGAIESQVLHCFVRSFRPRRIIEVGSGVSTVCMIQALRQTSGDGGPGAEIFCVEPYPKPGLQGLSEISIKKSFVQEVDRSFFDQLERGDLLFIDSSHAVKTGSDVLFLFLEVIPRLKPGVFIHVHDIYLPYSYPRNTLQHYLGFQETAILLALLKGSTQLKTLCCLSALHYDRRGDLARIAPDYTPEPDGREGLAGHGSGGYFPSSIWLQTM